WSRSSYPCRLSSSPLATPPRPRGGAHQAPAGRLHFVDHVDAALRLDRQALADAAVAVTPKHLDLDALERHPGPDPPDEGPHFSIYIFSGHGRRIQLAIFRAESRRMRGPDGGLRHGLDATIDQVVERPDQQPSPDVRKVTLESRSNFVSGNRDALLRQDRSRIDASVHLHDGDAGFGVTAEDRPLDRGRPAMARQQRGMDVERSEPRRPDEAPRKKLAEGRRHPD